MLAQKRHTMTATEFLDTYEGVDGKWQLINGVPYMMSGGSYAHANVGGNILVALRNKLRGTGCRPFNSDMGLGVGDDNVFYPDVTIYCDRRDLGSDPERTRLFEHPSIIFEVLSPSTQSCDRAQKVLRYRAVALVHTVVLVHPVERWIESYRRSGEEAWRVERLSDGDTLELDRPTVALTSGEIFAED